MKRRKWPRNRRVALITGSSCVIVYVTASNQRQIRFSDAAMHQNVLAATWESLIRQSFVVEKPVGKTNSLKSTWWYGIMWEELARGVLLTDSALTASVQIRFYLFHSPLGQMSKLHPPYGVRVCLSARKHTTACRTSGLMWLTQQNWTKAHNKPCAYELYHSWWVCIFHDTDYLCFNHQYLYDLYFLQ